MEVCGHEKSCVGSWDQPGWLYRTAGWRGGFLVYAKGLLDGGVLQRCDAAVIGRKSYEMGLKLGGVAHGDFAVVKEPPKPFIEALRRKKGKDIWLMGGGELTREFLREDLLDELYLGVVPVLIGEGIPAFPSGFPQREYKLTENKTFSQGLIALKGRARAEEEKSEEVSIGPARSKGLARLTQHREQVDLKYMNGCP
jgi:RibD C-terminal domain